MDLELKKQIEIVEQRLQYHFGGVNQKWEIPEGMPFMKEVLNEIDKLCAMAKKVGTSENSLHKHVVSGELPLTKEHICFNKGHSYFIVTTIDNGSSVYGHYKCSRCGHEDNYQYDYH